MIGDVQSLLDDGGQKKEKDDGLPKSLTSVGPIRKSLSRKSDTMKKPGGMNRELFNLLSLGDTKEITSLIPTDIKKGYRNPKAQIGLRYAKKYKWAPFINEARTDGLQLYHWARCDTLETPSPYLFAKFNKVISIPTYTAEEYDKHLKSAKWSKEETNYLFEVCRQFDLRWPIVVDRYDKTKFGVVRSMEDMKERFYAILHELTMLRDPGAGPICYDAEHERRRKEQLCKQWNRTKEEIEEEEDLLRELKNIEARKKERERKAQDLQKLINMAEAPCSPSVAGGMSPAIAKKKNQFRHKTGSIGSSSTTQFNPVEVSVTAIRYPEFKSAGAHLRSQEMKLPTNMGQKKMKNIEVVLEKCKMEMNPMGSEEMVNVYNEFRSQVMLLQELKATLSTAEFELESMRNKLQETTGKSFEIEPRMRMSGLHEGGLLESQVTPEESTPSTLRRITSWIDISTAANPVVARKRKTLSLVSSASPMDLKRDRPRKS